MKNGATPIIPIMHGLIAAPYTPIDTATGDIRLDVIGPYVDTLVADGVTGAFVCGTTGEGVSLTLHERMAVAARWCEAARGRLDVFVHVGDCSQRNAMALAAHAADVGATGIAAMPAFFIRPADTAALVAFCAPIAAAAPNVPFYYYHIPSMSGVTASMLDYLTLAIDRIPTFRGVKFTHGDLMEFQRCQSAFADRLELAWGVDEMLVGAIAVGATAAVGSTYNYAAPLYRKLIAAHDAGDHAEVRRLGALVCEMVAILVRNGVLRTGKAAMAMRGVDCGPPRPPLTPLSPQDYADTRECFDRLGIWNRDGQAATAPVHEDGNGAGEA